MTRVEFTHKLALLINHMWLEQEQPILDYVKRSDEEQHRLFIEGKSQCDGVKNRSFHQSGKAADIYFVENGRLTDPRLGWEFWHDQWKILGGKQMIEWDKSHFE